MHSKTPVLTLAALLVAGLVLAACDQEEQGRILTYEKGNYLVEPDTALTDEQVNELRHRAMRQAGG
jgi:hypothetical protein